MTSGTPGFAQAKALVSKNRSTVRSILGQRPVRDPVREGVAARPEIEDVDADVHREGLARRQRS